MSNVINRQDTLQRLKLGIDTLANVVKTTSGSKGRTFLIKREDGTFHITKDGVTLAKAVSHDDVVAELACRLLEQAANKTVENAGDATSATITIAQVMANLIMDQMSKGVDHTKLLYEIEESLDVVLKALKKQAKPVKSVQKAIEIATIALNNDKYYGELIGETVWAARENGIVQFEESENSFTEVVQQQGSRYDRPYPWKELLGKSQIKVAYENPLLYVFTEDVESINQIKPLIDESHNQGRPLVIFATDFSNIVIQTIIQNHHINNLKVLPIIMPGYGDEKVEQAKDIASIVEDDNVYKLVADRFGFTIFTKEYTPYMQERSDFIGNQIENESTKYYREVLEKRLSILNQKVFTVHVGAPSEVEMKELKDRIEDALLATRCAVEDGYVLGGGLALLNASQTLDTSTLGGQIMLKAAQSTYYQIGKNANMELEPKYGNIGFNTNTMQYEDFTKSGIIDAYRVIEQALINATSVVKTIISLNGTIIDNKKIVTPQFKAGEGWQM